MKYKKIKKHLHVIARLNLSMCFPAAQYVETRNHGFKPYFNIKKLSQGFKSTFI